MRPSLTNRFRVATVVRGSENEVLARLADLPSTIRVRTTATTAGVVVTLEQERRRPLAWRRRTIRSLRRQLDLVTRGTTRIDPNSADMSGTRHPQLTHSAGPSHRARVSEIITECIRMIANRSKLPAPLLGRDHESTTSCP